jgi:hypothetical protein
MAQQKTGSAEQDAEQGTYFAAEGNVATVPIKALAGTPQDAEPRECEAPADFSSEEMRLVVNVIKAYCQRKGHITIGVVMQLGEALGLELAGNLALVDGGAENILLMPHLNERAVRLFQYLADDEITHWHPVSEDSYDRYDPTGLRAKQPAADIVLWNHDQPQLDAAQWYWLPLVLCAAREGDLRDRVMSLDLDGLKDIISDLIRLGDAPQPADFQA